MAASWGCLPLPGPVRTLEQDWRFESLPTTENNDSLLPYGCGRSYGDSCINANASHLSTARLNRFIEFDSENGVLECEAGLTLDEILRLIVPRGWFLPVVPGTQFITLGGAIANDVHGKNHHRAGSFGCHVHSLQLLRSDGQRPVCSAREHSELFAATIGGLGLTGLITRATIKLIAIASDQLVSQDLAFSSLAEFVQLSEDSTDWDYTVAWVDTFARRGKVGRGIFSRARHANRASTLNTRGKKSLPGIPFTPPFSLVNRHSVDLFNRLYFSVKGANTKQRHSHYQPFFFPLDGIGNWNRIYGHAGFYQYQCVVPHDGGEHAIQELLTQISTSGQGSFLAVLKAFGERRSPGLLSFPRPGLTLALDFPNKGEKTRKLLNALDQTVLRAGGALYPAKDARMPADVFHSGFPQIERFRTHIDPGFSSSFWRRVQI